MRELHHDGDAAGIRFCPEQTPRNPESHRCGRALRRRRSCPRRRGCHKGSGVGLPRGGPTPEFTGLFTDWSLAFLVAPRSAVEPVAAGSALQLVPVGSAEQPVGAVAALQPVPTLVALEPVVATAAEE